MPRWLAAPCPEREVTGHRPGAGEFLFTGLRQAKPAARVRPVGLAFYRPVGLPERHGHLGEQPAMGAIRDTPTFIRNHTIGGPLLRRQVND